MAKRPPWQTSQQVERKREHQEVCQVPIPGGGTCAVTLQPLTSNHNSWPDTADLLTADTDLWTLTY